MRESNDLVYGIHPVEEALRNPRRRFVKLWATRNAVQRLAAAIETAVLAPEIVLPKALDRRLGTEAVHQGVLLEAQPLAQPGLEDIAHGFVVLLDQVTDPHNVGAIMRSCAAFGVAALVTTARHSPETSGVLFKAASGAFEQVPLVLVTNLARAMGDLKERGFRTVGLDSEAPLALSRLDPTPPIGLVLGAEGKGLRHLTRATCDALVRIELAGPIQSLNVSNAAAIALYALAGRVRSD